MTVKGVLERARQRLHIGERNFKPTPSVRIPSMLQEAEEFSHQLLTYKSLLQRYDKQLNTFLSSLPVLCRVNLPRVWEAVEGTAMCEPTAAEISSRFPHRVGGDYDEVLMADAHEIMRRRLDGIIRPIDRWCDSLSVVRKRLRKLEGLRMEVDARRRRVHARYQRALERMTGSSALALAAQGEHVGSATVSEAGGGALGGSYGVGRLAEELEEEADDEDLDSARNREDHAREALQQHRQLEALSASYSEAEQLVFDQLSGLVRDSAYFKSYVVAAMLVIKDTMQATLVALGRCMRPLPGFSEVEGETGAEARYGRAADITDLITALPPSVRAGGRAMHGPISSSNIGYDTIRPKRMTAQPLQVAADDTVSPMARFDPVPAVMRGASAFSADRIAASQAAEEQEAGGGHGTGLAAEPAGAGYPAGGYTGGYSAGVPPVKAFQAIQSEVAEGTV